MGKLTNTIDSLMGRIADALEHVGMARGRRTVSLIIIHCSAVRPQQTSSAAQIDAWHKARGWRGIGYHYVIRRNGEIELGRPESHIGAHCLGHNEHSIGICYEGGLDAEGRPADTRTEEQKTVMLILLQRLKARYPEARIAGHNEFSYKACPCFDVRKELEQYGL